MLINALQILTRQSTRKETTVNSRNLIKDLCQGTEGTLTQISKQQMMNNKVWERLE